MTQPHFLNQEHKSLSVLCIRGVGLTPHDCVMGSRLGPAALRALALYGQGQRLRVKGFSFCLRLITEAASDLNKTEWQCDLQASLVHFPPNTNPCALPHNPNTYARI